MDNALNSVIEIKYGLLDELFERGILNEQQKESIESGETRFDQVSKLLKEVKKLSQEHHEHFLSALDKSGQSHVANFIRNEGQRPTTDSENWPIYGFDEWKRIVSNWCKLKRLIDARNGLLHELVTVRFINSQQKRSLAEQPDDTVGNEMLLMICRRSSFVMYKKFIECLIKTSQEHVASLLEPAQYTTVLPLSEEHVNTLTTNHSKLIDLIDINAELTAKLLLSGVVTRRHQEYIESAAIKSTANSRLLDMVERGSEQNYLKFIDCLNDVGQSHVANVLQSNGVVVEMVAQTDLSTAEEEHVIEQFKNLYIYASPASRERLRCELDKLSPQSQDNQLIAMKTVNSIRLFILCTSLSGLHYLNELYTNDQLRPIFEEILFTLLNCKRPVTVSLEWNTHDYDKWVQHLSAISGLTVYSKLHQLAQQSQYFRTSFVHHSLPINELAHELLERLLLKATGQLFVTFKNVVPSPHVVTATTLHTVCLYWWDTLTHRQTNRQLLMKFFKQKCAPSRFNPKLVSSVRLQQGHRVCGVAELHDKLFIASYESNAVKVFSIVGPSYYDLGEGIKVPELRSPGDMAVSRANNCLYVSDTRTDCIWRISSSSLFLDTAAVKVDKFIVTENVPLKLSIQSSRLLVTFIGSTELHVYSCDDGKLIRKIGLPPDMLIHHAVELSNRTAIVCHGNRKIAGSNVKVGPSVSEVSLHGRIIRAYKGAVEFEEPWYVTFDCTCQVLVCDRECKRLVLLNRELELEHIVLTEELSGRPSRACYSKDRSRLYVSYFNDVTVDVFTV